MSSPLVPRRWPALSSSLLAASVTLAACTLSTGCGAKQTPGEGAASGYGEATPGATEAPVEVRNTATDCSDGSCFACGDNICLSNQYCDTATSACNWLPECPKEPSCGCVKKVLSDCSCSEDGGVRLSCE